MSPRPSRRTWSLPSGRDAAVLLVLAVATGSLAGSGWVRAQGGPPARHFRAAAPARMAAAGECDPQVTSLSAGSAPAAGGIPITIYGSHFTSAGAAPIARFGHSVAVIQSASDAELVVLVPPQGGGEDASVTVGFADGRRSMSVPFLYDAPVVTPEPDATASFGRGTVLTVHGSNFRCANPRAWLEDAGSGATAECDVLEAADESLVVALPDWSTPTATLHIGIVHRDIAARNVLLDGPQLVSVSPATWPAYGGTLITLTGSSFFSGQGGSRVEVLRGGRRVEAPIVTWTPTEIVAVAPDMPGNTGGQSEVEVLAAHDSTRSNTFTCKLDDAAERLSLVSPAGGPAAGGTVITITGQNFRSGDYLNVGGVVVVLDGIEATRATATLPPLPPGPVSLQLVRNGSLSPPLEFESLSPPELVSVEPAAAPVEGRTILTLHGSNFGASDVGLPRAASVGQGGGVTANAGPVRWIAPGTLEIVAPPGQPGPADLTLEIAGVPVTLPDAFTYAGSNPDPGPELLSLSPPGLSRLGGNVVTLTGSNFGPPGSSRVIFGSTEVTPLTQSDTGITFAQPPLPAGVVQNPIYVEKGNQGSNPLFEGKREALLSGVSGLPAPAAGGVLITITGADFGPESRVLFTSGDGASTERPPLLVTPSSLVVSTPEVAGHDWSGLQIVRDGLASAALAYTIAGPRLTGVSARELSPGGGTVLTVIGQDFGPGARVEIGGRRSFKEFSPAQDQLKGNPRHRTGPALVPVRVVDAGGMTSDSLMLRWKAPELNSGSDTGVRADGGTVLTIAGRDFGRSAAITISGNGFFATPPVLERSDTQLVVPLDAAPPGAYEVTVGDPDLGASPPATLYRLAPPIVTGVSPSIVPLAGNVPLTIHGANFGPPGATVARRFGVVGMACVLDATRSQDDEVVLVAPPSSAEGPADLVVVVDGVADTIPAAFTYGGTTDVPPAPGAPRTLALRAGPTPFRDALGLAFAVPAAGRWQLDLFDARGARVRRWEGDSPGALHELRWDGRTAAGAAAPPGVYFARLTAAGAQRLTRAVKLE